MCARLGLLMLTVLTAAPTAQAASVKELFEQHGLMGAWAADCTKLASQQNQYIVHRALDAERVQRDTMIGATERFAVVVLESAARSAPHEITIAASGYERRFNLTFRPDGRRFRVMQYSREDGTKYIVDGRRVGSAADGEGQGRVRVLICGMRHRVEGRAERRER